MAMGITYAVQAQNCAPNGITTNPAAPVNNQRPSKRNTFDWTKPSFPLKHALTGINATAINSPFFTTDNANIGQFYDPNDGIKDVYPNQGWELIKKDFGYNDLGQPNNPGTTNPYLILYNKYRGLLRLFVARGENNPYNGANIQIYFDQLSPMRTSLLDNNAELKAIDGTFTTNPILSSIPDFLNLPLKWFYADFPMMYDPCTCLFSSKLNIKITLSSTSQVTGTTTTTGDLVSNTQPTSAQNNRGSFSIGDLKNTTKKVVQTYKSSYAFETDIKPLLSSSTKKDNFSLFTKQIGKSDFLKNGLASIPYLGDALSILDFFVGGGKKATAPQPVEIMPMSINMTGQYNGTIQTLYDYNTITFRTPGSNVSGATDSEYPYYNEVMGIFNLLRTPKLQIKYYNTFSSADSSYTQSIYMKLASDIQYVINPASDLTVQDIQVAVVGNSLGGLSGNNLGYAALYEGQNAKYGPQYRTQYRNIGAWAGTLYSFSRTTSFFPTVTASNWRIKVMVNFKRKDTTASTQNVLFVATFPITVEIAQVSSAQDPAFIAFTTNLSGNNGLIPAVSASAVNAFCNSSTYKTSQRKFLRYKENLQKMEDEEQQKEKQFLNKLPLPGDNEFVIFPNPVSDNTMLRYNVPTQGPVKITLSGIVFNLSEVSLIENQHQAGNFTLPIDVSKYPKGIYFCTLEVGGQGFSKKLIIP